MQIRFALYFGLIIKEKEVVPMTAQTNKGFGFLFEMGCG